MYIKNIDKGAVLFDTGYYVVVSNEDAGNEPVASPPPNYLVVNKKTRAVEFQVDQLPAAVEAANHFTRSYKALAELPSEDQQPKIRESNVVKMN